MVWPSVVTPTVPEAARTLSLRIPRGSEEESATTTEASTSEAAPRVASRFPPPEVELDDLPTNARLSALVPRRRLGA